MVDHESTHQNRLLRWCAAPVVWLAVLAIRIYQRVISPRFPPRCIFEPTCSSYAVMAIRRHGPVAGTRYTLDRIRRCDGGVFEGSDYPPGCEPLAGAATLEDASPQPKKGLLDLKEASALHDLSPELQQKIHAHLKHDESWK